jgi:hypothetical protein
MSDEVTSTGGRGRAQGVEVPDTGSSNENSARNARLRKTGEKR